MLFIKMYIRVLYGILVRNSGFIGNFSIQKFLAENYTSFLYLVNRDKRKHFINDLNLSLNKMPFLSVKIEKKNYNPSY
jgi:hypothetical protein